MKFLLIWLVMGENWTWIEWDIIDWIKLSMLQFNCKKKKKSVIFYGMCAKSLV